MASVELVGVSKSFGKVEAVRDVSLTIADRELVVFVGPSGCGKSTLLRMIAGLEEIEAGELRIGAARMNDVPAADRGIAMVFQSYALYPHMSVAQNMGFGLKMSGVPSQEVAAKVAEAARILQIEDLLDRRPRQLSGGQRQRVAIGRAITRAPDVFLFDEPLSNLDADLRAQMRVEIARLRLELRTTMIYVTHDQVEAMTLADRIVVLNRGRIEQVGAPLDLYERPANLFVAGFLGQPKINLLAATVTAPDTLTLAAGGTVALPRAPAAPGTALTLGIRPDAIVVSETASPGGIPARLELVEHLGGQSLLHLRLPGADRLVTAEQQGKTRLAPGAAIWLTFAADRLHLFGGDGQRLEQAATGY